MKTKYSTEQSGGILVAGEEYALVALWVKSSP